MKTLFVSYAHDEAPWCKNVLKYLDPTLKDWVSIWVDYSLVGGEEFAPAIKHKVQIADGFLVMASKKYLNSDYIQQFEWPWIKQELENGKKLFWIPQDVNPQQDAPSEILKYLSARQAAHGKSESITQLQEKGDLDNALLSLMERMRVWASQQDTPNYQAVQTPQLNEQRLQKVRRNYLDAISNSYMYIKTSILNERDDKDPFHRLPLEQIYITLQADQTTIQERRETHALFQEMANDTKMEASDINVTFQDQLAKIISDQAPIPDRPEAVKLTSSDDELEAVFRRERVLVILGDPGSGKSVLCRWFALQMANNMLGQNSSDKVDLGLPRFPILLRVAKFAEFLKNKYSNCSEWRLPDQADNDNDLYNFLGEDLENDFLSHYLNSRPEEPITANQKRKALHEISTVCRSAIESQQAVLLVDGLDEVIDFNWRGGICATIDHFIAKKIMPHSGNRPDQISPFAAPGVVGGNQVVITSRITGYHLAKLETPSAAHFVIRPLDDDKVADLCRKVGSAVDCYGETTGTGEEFLKTIQCSSGYALERLTRNPLLLTTLFFYYVAHGKNLPTTRVELYRKLTLDLVRRWGLTEPDGCDNAHVYLSLEQKLRQIFHDKSQQEREEFLLKLLATVAMRIHKDFASGRVSRRDLENIFRFNLKELINVHPLQAENDDFIKDAKQLADLVAERLGVMVELAPDLFGFLHLTFQEYLVGWKLLQQAKDAQLPLEESLLGIFMEHLGDARWREPLLFAFGELAQHNNESSNASTAKFLARLGSELGTLFLADETIFIMADLLDEMNPQLPASDEWREVVLALLQGYAGCGLRPSTANRRWRFAEKIAELRRRQPVLVPQLCLAFLNENNRLACPIAHLFWQRLWLLPDVLMAFSARQQLDSTAWDWPMHTALSQNLKANSHLVVEPLEKLTPPAEDDVMGIRLYEAGLNVWQQQRQLFNEREWELDCLPVSTFALYAFFSQTAAAWTNMAREPGCLRVLVTLLGAVDNLEAMRWMREYRWIAEFLQGADSQRNQRMLTNPGVFVPCWGVTDPIYNMAVYLDTDPDGRFKRQSTVPKLGAEFIVTRLPPQMEQMFQLVAKSSDPSQTLNSALQHLARHGDTDSRVLAMIGLILIGIEVADKATQELLDACRRSVHRLRDAVFRAVTSQAQNWFGLAVKKDEPTQINPELFLGDAQLSIIYRCVTDAAITSLDAAVWVGVGGQNQMAVTTKAHQWASRFSKQSDDFVYNFAVLLDTEGPQAAGWQSALPLLSRILTDHNLRYVPSLEPAYYPPFWGIVPEEKLIPPAFFQAVERLAWAAGDLNFDFALGFGELFLKHILASGVSGLQKNWTLFLLGIDLTGVEADPRLLQRLGASLLTHAHQLEERLHSFDLTQDSDWDSLLNTPNIEDAILQLELALSDGRLVVTEKTASSFLSLVNRLADSSPFDACLFLARAAQYAPAEMAQSWVAEALRRLAHIDDAYAKAEFLARLRQIPGGLSEVLDNLHKKRCEELKAICPILAAHASGRVGRHLCQPEFFWNAPDKLGTDPAWVVVASYAALSEIINENATRQDFSGLWKNLSEAPDLSQIDELLARAGANGLECTTEAISALNQLKNRSDLHLSRLVTLLSRSVSATLPLLQTWLTKKDDSVYSDIFQGQAALLLAERNRVLTSELIGPLFALRKSGDDMTATRAEIALTSPFRNAEREQRRFSLKKHGLEVAQLLAVSKLSNRANSDGTYLSRCAGLALNDWYFDDAEALQGWCELATAGSEAEDLLLQAINWVDIWSADCQIVLCAWLLAASGSAGVRRHDALIQWAARLAYMKKATLEPEVFMALSKIPDDDPIRQLRCFAAADNKHAEYEYILTVLESLSKRFDVDANCLCIEAEQQLDASLTALFPEGNQGAPDQSILRILGNISYFWIGEYPEDCLPLVLPYLNNSAFMVALMNWLHGSIKNLPDNFSDLNTAKSKIEARKIEALLSFAVCFSERNPSVFIRDAETRNKFLVDLARLCYLAISRRSHMAVVTLISRLKKVDLDQTFVLNGNPYTVLDALLCGLHDDGNVQQRVAEVLPKIKGLQGGKVIAQISELISGAGTASQRGSVVLAAAQLLQRLLHGNALTSHERSEAGRLLRDAANAPQNRRPLYRQTGSGKDGDPVTVVYAGDLAEELASLTMRKQPL